MRGEILLVAALGLAVFLSALALVYAQHESRKLFAEVQALQERRDALTVEWGQLQLEQSTWGAHGRVEQVTSTQLDMMIPPTSSVVLVRP